MSLKPISIDQNVASSTISVYLSSADGQKGSTFCPSVKAVYLEKAIFLYSLVSESNWYKMTLTQYTELLQCLYLFVFKDMAQYVS